MNKGLIILLNFLIVLIFTLSTLPVLYANDITQTIRGQIIDKESKSPLTAANVLLLESDPPIVAVSDANGNFRIDNVNVGLVSLQITYMGYRPVVLPNIRLSSGRELILTIEMEEMVFTTEEFIIEGEQEKHSPINEMASVSSRTFNADDTRRFAGSLNDPSRMATNFAGVGVANDDRNDIIIRGNSPMGLLWRLEGVDIPNPNHFSSLGTTGGPVSILNNNLLDNSDFFTGAFPAEYGNALAGVFDLRMRRGNNEKREYVGQIGFNGFELGAEGPFKKDYAGSYLVNYRYSTLSVFQSLGFSLGTGDATPQYQDVSYKLNFPVGNTGRLSLFGIAGKSYIELLYDSEDTTDIFSVRGFDAYYGAQMGVTGASFRHFFNNDLFMDFALAASTTSQKIRLDSISVADDSRHLFFGDKSSEHKLTAFITLNKKFNARNTIQTGALKEKLFYNYADSVLNDDGNYRQIRNFDGSSYFNSLYFQWQHKFTNDFTLNTGIYASYFEIHNKIFVEPRAGLRWRFRPRQTLSFGAGMHSQRQPLSVYFYRTPIDPAQGTYLETNKELGPTKSIHLISSYENILTENLFLKTEIYYQYLYEVPVRRNLYPHFSMLNAGADFGIPGVDSLVNEGTGRNYGIEVTLEKFFSRQYYGLFTVSLFESKYTGADGLERNTAFNSNKVFNLLGGKEFNIGDKGLLSFDIRTVWSGGRRFIPIDLDSSRSADRAVYITEEAYNERFEDYFRLDFRISFSIERKKMTHQWHLDIQNVTDRRNVFIREYDVITEEIVTSYQLGLFPIVQYRVLF